MVNNVVDVEARGMSDPFEARKSCGNWFMQLLNEIDQDRIEDEASLNKLRGMVAEASAQWQLETGYSVYGLPTDPPADE